MSDRSVSRIEQKATPDGMQPAKLGGLARAFETSPEQLEAEWKKTPVPAPTLRRPQITALGRLVQRHGLDRAATIAAAMEWLDRQSEEKQREVLGLKPTAKKRAG
jgi:hypothetical protein